MDLLNLRVKEAKAILFGNNLTWHKAPSQFIRINTDAAIKDGGSMVGIVARNSEGEILKIWAIPFHSDFPELAEAFGINQGLIKEKEEGWS